LAQAERLCFSYRFGALHLYRYQILSVLTNLTYQLFCPAQDVFIVR